MIPLAISATLAALVAAGVALVILRQAPRLGLIDLPTDRSSHVQPTPRGGGIGVVAGVSAGLLVLFATGTTPDRSLLTILFAAGIIAILGAADDLRSIAARHRLLVQVGAALIVVVGVGPIERLPLPSPFDVPLGWLGLPLTVLWLAAVTNFFNFMDGIDGLATGQAVVSSLGIAIAAFSGGATSLAVLCAAAGLGFLLLNWAPAKIFLGDVGSTTLGFLLAALPLLAPAHDRHHALLAVAVGLALFLLDPAVTLGRRILAGAKLGVAHREHSYQRITAGSTSHGLAAAGITLCGLVLAVAGALSYRANWLTWPAVGLGVGAYLGLAWLGRRARRGL